MARGCLRTARALYCVSAIISLLLRRRNSGLYALGMEIELMAIPEIAELMGVTRQRASKIIQTHDDFPEPVAVLSIGRVWLRPTIEHWERTHPRRSGRPVSNQPK